VILLLLQREVVGFLYLLGVRVPWRNGEGRMVLRFAALFFSCFSFFLLTYLMAGTCDEMHDSCDE